MGIFLPRIFRDKIYIYIQSLFKIRDKKVLDNHAFANSPPAHLEFIVVLVSFSPTIQNFKLILCFMAKTINEFRHFITL